LHHANLLRDLAVLASLQEAFDHASLGNQVVLVPIRRHLCKDFFSKLKVSAFVCSIDERVLTEVVWLGFLGFTHGLLHLFTLFKSAVQVEELEYSRVKDGVHFDAFVLQHAFLYFFSLANILVLDARFKQSSLSEFVDFYFPLDHLDIENFHAFLNVSLISLCFYENTESHIVRFHFLLVHHFLNFQRFGNILLHYAHIHNAVLKHAVYLNFVVLQFIKPAEDLTVGLTRGNESGLLLHAFDHRALCLLVGCETRSLHLLEK